MVFKKLYELSIGELKTEFRRAGLDGDFSVGYAVVRLTVKPSQERPGSLQLSV